MSVTELHFTERSAWRAWLETHHDTVRVLWLVFYKKHTGRPSVDYDDAVEEALCFGWIDGIVKRLDDERYARRFTPRINTKRWSAVNVRRVEKMKKAGLMTDAGLAKIPDDIVPLPARQDRPTDPPPWLAAGIAKSAAAAEFFKTLAPSYRRDYIAWVCSAKREETRQKRLAGLVERLEQKKKPGLK